MKCFLAVDIGASSGRHIVGILEDGKLRLEEVYRFENGAKRKDENSSLCWDADGLFASIVAGMKATKEAGFIPESMAIDTWAVDFALLDAEGNRIGDTVAYRDDRTEGMDEIVYGIIPQKELYARTGIQKLIINTIYQLMAVKEKDPEALAKAETMLMIPDYFHYLLTGKMVTEYTNATTTQLINPATKDWDMELIEKLGFPTKIFTEVALPGTVLGDLLPEIAEQVGFNCKVVLPATHDTGSAVMAVPCTEGQAMYISSGTWSLMGIENSEALCDEKSMELNFTNEGGYDYRYRYLKNIMGLWMIQSIRHEFDDAFGFGEICERAEECKDFPSRVEANDECFLAPKSMIAAVQDYCRNTDQPVPEGIGQLATVVYQSLAVCYGKTAAEIEEATGKTFDELHVIGGGANADYLNQLTADATGKTVIAGPTEATAIGNLVAQMIVSGEFASLEEARGCIAESFPLKTFTPSK